MHDGLRHDLDAARAQGTADVIDFATRKRRAPVVDAVAATYAPPVACLEDDALDLPFTFDDCDDVTPDDVLDVALSVHAAHLLTVPRPATLDGRHDLTNQLLTWATLEIACAREADLRGDATARDDARQNAREAIERAREVMA